MTVMLISCGSVFKGTRGVPTGFFSEAAFPPFNRRVS
jgi:hypothetical protein